MFCPYCGTPVAEKTAFCVNCGGRVTPAPQPAYAAPNPYEAQLQQYQMAKEATRQKELEALSAAITHFSQKANAYKDYDDACKKVNHYAPGAKVALLVWGIIVAAIGLLMLFTDLSEGASPEAALLVLFLPGNAMIAFGIVMKLRSSRNLERYREQYGHLSVELMNHYLSYPNCPVSPEYTNPEVLIHFYRMIQSGRADTIRDCVLQFGNGRETNQYLTAIRQNTTDINAQTGISTFFVPASFFL